MEMIVDKQRCYEEISNSFVAAESIRYGDSSVSEQAHALQCAELADAANADETLVMASLLHDVARFAVPQNMVSDTLQDVKPDQKSAGHGEMASRLLTNLLPERALFCIRHHGEAKQYLCRTSPGYRSKLADASIATLRIQEAQTSPEQLDRLAQHEWWSDALRVRAWDDAAKVANKKTRSLDYWLGRLARFVDLDS